MSTLIVIPTYNELDSLPVTLAAIHAYAPRVDVLIADDNSPDGTGRWADERAAEDARVNVLHRQEKAGLGPAYVAGFQWALEREYEVICEMDADGSHRGKDLPLLLDAVAGGADLAIGSRWVPGGAVVNWPRNRHMLSRGANIYVDALMGMGVKDATAGFRAYRRETLAQLDLAEIASQGYCFQIDMTKRVHEAGLSIVEVPIVFVERELGESKMHGSIIREAVGRVAQWGAQRRLSQARRLVGRVTAGRAA